MKAIALLMLFAVVACLVEARAPGADQTAAVPKAPLSVDFAKLEASEGLTKERLEQFREAVEAFKNKIDATRLNPARKEAIKQEAMTRLTERIAKLKQKPVQEA